MKCLRNFFKLGVGSPLTALPSTMEMNGNLVPAAALQSVLTQINAANIASDGVFLPAVVSGASATVTALQNSINRFTNAGAITLTLDYAYNVVNLIPNPFVGQTFPFWILTTGAGGSIATPTLSDTAITLAGTTSVSATSLRAYQGIINQITSTSGAALTSGTTFTSLTQVGSTNAYTVALGTNAISPTVGQVILINVTAGTLPSGWYPIVKVTSATSFVIVAPIAGTAWTATAATLPGTTVAPATYSPLVTITGAYQVTAAA